MLSTVTLAHLLSPLLFFHLPLTSSVSVITETCGFLFCQNILWVWHGWGNQRMHATCCMTWRRQPDSFFFFFSFFPSLRLRGDHQRRQLETQINYNREDDPTSSDFSCVFLFPPPRLPPLVFVCIYSSSAISHIFSCTKRSLSPKRLGDGHGNLRLHIERKLPVAVLMRVRPL